MKIFRRVIICRSVEVEGGGVLSKNLSIISPTRPCKKAGGFLTLYHFFPPLYAPVSQAEEAEAV